MKILKSVKSKAWFLAIALFIAGGLSALSHAQSSDTQSSDAQSSGVQNDTSNIAQQPVEVRHVTAVEAASLVQDNPEIVILDVRTPVEFKIGHLENAININYYSFSFKKQIAKLDRNKTYLVHCQSGVRSGKTMPLMLEAGFTNLIHMDGGYGAWKRAKLPIQ